MIQDWFKGMIQDWFKGMIQDWFLEECIHSNHLVFKIDMIKITCEHFIKFGVQVFEKPANNGFYLNSYFVHVYMALNFDCYTVMKYRSLDRVFSKITAFQTEIFHTEGLI